MDPAGVASVDSQSFANSDDKDFALSAKVSALPLAVEYDNEPLSAVANLSLCASLMDILHNTALSRNVGPSTKST